MSQRYLYEQGNVTFLAITDINITLCLRYRVKIPVFCKLYFFCQYVSLAVSVQSLLWIAVDRFMAVVFPMKINFISSRVRVIGAASTWILAIAANSKHLFAVKLAYHSGVIWCIEGKDELLYRVWVWINTVALVFFPLVIMTILYSAIGATLYRRQSLPVLHSLPEVLCKLNFFCQYVSLVVSVQSLIWIAVDRFMAVVFPMKINFISSRVRVFGAASTWIVAMTVNSKHLFAVDLVYQSGVILCIEDKDELLYRVWTWINIVAIVFFPLVIMTILYSAIGATLCRRRKKTIFDAVFDFSTRCRTADILTYLGTGHVCCNLEIDLSLLGICFRHIVAQYDCQNKSGTQIPKENTKLSQKGKKTIFDAVFDFNTRCRTADILTYLGMGHVCCNLEIDLGLLGICFRHIVAQFLLLQNCVYVRLMCVESCYLAVLLNTFENLLISYQDRGHLCYNPRPHSSIPRISFRHIVQL
ncbi:Substance-K receptor, partial [Acropora cervicornis]